jgi:ketosteroid isomerase-like protein
MKRITNIFALTLAVLGLFLLQAEGRAGVRCDSGDDEKALAQIERELMDAMLKGDAAPVERHYADSFTFTTPEGEVLGKAQVISNLKSGALKFESSRVDDMKVHVYGDAAVVTMRTTDRGKVNGVDVSGRYRWTDVFIRRGGRWQLVASQGTRIVQ